LIIFSSVQMSTCTLNNAYRDFWKAYFGIIKGKDFVLDVDCMGGKFDDLWDELKIDLISSNWPMILLTLEKIYILEKEKCPFDVYSSILVDFITALRNGTLFKNTLKNMSLLKEKISQFIKSDKGACAMGTCVGEITKIMTYGMGYYSWIDPHKEGHKLFLN
jgi:hypothetical protein